jgi:adenylate cyclase
VAVEIERRFLVSDPAVAIRGVVGVPVEQGYLAFGAGGVEVRLRRAGEDLTLTVKEGVGLVRQEHEVRVSVEQFNALWGVTLGRRIEKTRFRVAGSTPIDLDVYGGSLTGLIVAEVEFASAEESYRFVPPAWCEREITTDERFRNHSVVRLSADEVYRLISPQEVPG